MVSDLLSVSGADIVVIADDSGSMNAISDFKAHTTRWDELKNTLTSLAKMLLVVDHADGFHVQFLNDATWHEIHRPEEVVRLFTEWFNVLVMRRRSRGISHRAAGLQVVASRRTASKQDTSCQPLPHVQPWPSSSSAAPTSTS